MSIFKSIFEKQVYRIKIDFKKLVEVRRAKLISEGIEVNSINWELYAKILEAKNNELIYRA